MKVNLLLLLRCLFAFANDITSPPFETSAISQAVIDVINKSFMKDVSIINIITVPDGVERVRELMNEMVDEIAGNISSLVSVRVGDGVSVRKVKERRFYNVILISNYKSFETLNQSFVEELFFFQGFFLIVIVPDPDAVDGRSPYQSQNFDMEKIFRSLWQNFIVNVNILVSVSHAELELFTFYPYTAAHCASVLPTLTNRFINSTFINSENHYDDKLKDLFKCKLKVVSFTIAPLMFVEERGAVSGIDGELLKGKKSLTSLLKIFR